ncbi:hypothetical protein EYF80_026700 [Liparis tanakae]|uniref:Uncharacterized protein n=1 Tax=Liparis tanakae TaxID=230148 RepID=A0A4Z2HDV7_9TELE|nr:hypothetical protein EYF80_026700 [Liparis tanakae]
MTATVCEVRGWSEVTEGRCFLPSFEDACKDGGEEWWKRLHVSDEHPSVLRGLCSWRQTLPVPAAPLEPNGMRAVGEALDAQRVPGLEPRLVRQAGGVWRT